MIMILEEQDDCTVQYSADPLLRSMSMDPIITTSPRLAFVKRFMVIMLICWTLVVGASLIWNLVDERLHTVEIAKKEALVTFNKDQAFRFWATKHGGVYVPATEETPPNPYLSHVPDRDITLPSGKKLTLMNPAYALRQLMHDFEQDYGIKGHITSLKPLNPANAPDEWERTALQKFERGVLEVSETITIDGKPYLRLIRPMVARKGCLKCHAWQGYREGDIRGGVGISFPLDPFLIIERDARKILLATHGGIWLLGLGGIGFVYSRSRKNIVERTRAEEAARESRERFSHLVEATSDFVWEVDADHVCTYVSPKVKDILGYEPGELVGRSAFDLMPPDETVRLIPTLRSTAAARKPFSFFENVNVHKDGRRVILEDSGVPFFDSFGTFRGYRGMSRDVTERRHAEAEDRRLRAFFQNVAESIVTGVWVADGEDVIFYVNKAAVDIAGVSPAALIGIRVLDTISAPAMREFSLLYRRAKETLTPVRYDGLRFITPTGRESYQSGWLVPRTREGLRYDGMICTVEDVTERRKAAQLLALLNFALNSVHEAAYLIDEESRFQYVNEESCRALGYSRDELLGMSVAQVDPDFPHERWPDHWQELKAKGSLIFEGSHQARDGRIFPVEIQANYFEYDDRGYNLALVRDITERKRIEAALRASEQNLALHVLQTPLGVIEWNLAFEVTKWNPAAERIFGYSKSEALGAHASLIVPSSAKDRVDQVWSDLVRQKGGLRSTNENATKDGRLIYCEWYNTPLVDANGNVIAVASLVQDITERRRAEQQLAAQHALLTAILNSSRDIIIFSLDKNYCYTAFNEKHREEMKKVWDADIKIGMNLLDCMKMPELRELAKQSIDRALQGEVFTEVQHQPEPDIYYELIWNPVVQSGSIVGVTVFIRDITERIRAEGALRESERKYRDIFDNVLDTLYLLEVTPDGRFRTIEVNPALERMTGIPRSQSIGKTQEEIVPEEVARLVNAKYRRCVEAGHPIEEEVELDLPSGRRIFHSSLIPARDETGRVYRIIGISRDITERKRAVEMLREREAFIRNILDSVDESFIVVDRQYRILSANRAFCSLMKLPEDRVIGRLCYEVSHHATRPCFESGEDCAVRRTFETGAAHFVSHTHTEASGEKQYVEIKSYPITDAAGKVVSAIETINDITEKRKLEEQLRQAQKMEAVGTLAGGVAHDFNNILTAIIGYGNIVKMKMQPDDPLRASMDTILSSSERAAHLTQGLLAFSRKQIINPKPVDLNDIVKSVEKLLRRLIGEDVELSTQLAEQRLIAMADSGQIEQVLMNLATNARDAMPEGGMLTITTQEMVLDEEFMKIHAFGKPGRYALIAVSDTGTGMDAQTKEKIFEPFFTTKELGRGTGLGLSIVYGIIKQHNGSISAYSEPGKGSTFKIYLPLVAAAAETGEAEAVITPRGGTETILIAEDDQVVRELLRTILQNFGYRVLEAADGQEAIECFKSRAGDIDLLLIDVIMPKKSGRDVYDAVKAVKPDAKAIFMSGYTANVIHKKGVLDEGIQFISKPINPADLLRKIREVLDTKK